MKTFTKIWNAFTTALVLLIVLIAILLVGVRLIGLTPLYVSSGSMEPAFHVGSLIFVQKTDPAKIEVGDPITYTINAAGDYSTHRVIGIEVYETGVREMLDETGVPMLDEQGDVIFEEHPLEETSYYFQTKGDANDAPDGAPVYYKNVVGIPRLTIPYLGYLAQWLQTRQGMILGISIALVIVILTFLPDLLKLVDEPAEKKQEAAAAEAAEQAGETSESNAAEGE